MPRVSNELRTVKLTLSTTETVIDELRLLVRTGHYGKNPAEAAERLVAQRLHEIFGEEAVEAARAANDRQRE